MTNSVSSVAMLTPQTTSTRGREGGGGPVMLVNGRRISGFQEIQGIPPEAYWDRAWAAALTLILIVMLLNLVAVANSEEPGVLWGFIRRYAPDVSPQTHPRIDTLVHRAVRYFRDFVRPTKTYRLPDEVERRALADLRDALEPCEGSTDAEALQAVVYEIGRRHFPDTSGKSKSPDGRPGVSRTWF